MRPQARHAIVAAVALASFGTALNDGGYAIGFIAGAAFAIWWAIVATVATGLLPREAISRDAAAVGLLLLAFAGWTALSIVWASDGGAAFVEVVRVLSYLGLFVLVVLSSGREGARPWLAGLAIGLAGVVLLALASRFDPAIGDQSILRDRLNYPIGYWNGLGILAAQAATLLLWFAAHGGSRLVRAAATAALPAAALAVYLSASRGGAGVAAIGVVALFALGPGRRLISVSALVAGAGAAALVGFASSQHALVDGLTNSDAYSQGRLLLVVAVLVTVAVGAGRWALDRRLTEWRVPGRLRRLAIMAAILGAVGALVLGATRWDDFKQTPERAAAQGTLSSNGLARGLNGSGRYQFWHAALDAFEEEPVHGIGAGQYETWWNQHGSIYWVLKDAHSLLFETLGELGVVGLVLIGLFLVIAFASGWSRRRAADGPAVAALLALFVVSALGASIDWTWELPTVFAPLLIAAALMTGPATRLETGQAATGVSPHVRLAGRLATIAISVAALWCAGDLLLMRANLGDSRSALDGGDSSAAVGEARDAISVQPWAAAPRFQLGLALEAGDRLGAARSALEAAERRAPEDWQIAFVLARVEARSGAPLAANLSLDRARRLNPRATWLERVTAGYLR